MPSAGSIPIVSLKPVSCGTTMWRRGGALQVTVVVKATFGMMHGGPARLIAPVPLVAEDRYATPGGSLAEPTDLAPFLPNAGVMLWGHACAPQPMPAVTVRLAVYRERPLVDKVLHVFGDRAAPGAQPMPFQKMPIIYERAHGGPSFIDNPVGVSGGREPNIVHATDPRRVGGFGPLSSRWGSRRRALKGAAEPTTDFPDGFDFRWFQPAPSDQQCEYLHGDEWIVLDGMHATQPRLQTQLPSVRAAAVWVAPGPRGRQGKHLSLSADTLLIDADRHVCSLIWRGHFALERADALPHLKLLTGVEMPGYPIVWPDEAYLEPRPVEPEPTVEDPPPGEHAPTEKIVLARIRGAALPFSKAAPGDPGPRFAAPVTTTVKDERTGEPGLNSTVTDPVMSPFAALPFNKNAPLPLVKPPPPSQRFSAATPPAPFAPGLPFANAPPPPAAAPPPSARAPQRSTWGDDAEDHTRMVDPSMVAASGSLPFAIAPPGTTEKRAPSLAGTPWAMSAAAAAAEIKASAPGAETIMARAEELRRLPLGGGPPPVAPPSVAPPPVVAPPPGAAPPPGGAPPPPMVAAPPPVVAPPPPMVAAPPAIVAPPPPAVAAPPPIVAPPPPMVTAPPAIIAPPPTPPVVAASPPPAVEASTDEAAPSAPGSTAAVDAPPFSQAAPPSLSGIRATVMERVKAREPLRDLQLAGADLSDLDLSGAMLSGLDLRGAKLMRAKLTEARLADAQLCDADLGEADLTRADLTRADLSRAALGLARLDEATLAEANLSGAHGHGASFAGARATRTRFARGEWDGASFAKADLTDADLTGASIAAARFEGASLIQVHLTDARGRGAVFDDARLPQALLHGASFPGASFARVDAVGSTWESAVLDEASFPGATLKEANLARASCAKTDLAGVDLTGANLQRLSGDGVKLDGARLDKADLRQARMRDAQLEGASMRGVLAGKADLSGGNFARADLEGATLRAARLQNASFVHANLEGADLRDADLDHTNVFGASRKTAKMGSRGIIEVDPALE